jgi:hypothetical protein
VDVLLTGVGCWSKFGFYVNFDADVAMTLISLHGRGPRRSKVRIPCAPSLFEVTGTYHTMGGENLHEIQFNNCELPLENPCRLRSRCYAINRPAASKS